MLAYSLFFSFCNPILSVGSDIEYTIYIEYNVKEEEKFSIITSIQVQRKETENEGGKKRQEDEMNRRDRKK